MPGLCGRACVLMASAIAAVAMLARPVTPYEEGNWRAAVSSCPAANCTHPIAPELPSPLPDRFRWLHIPKTGTSFAIVLYHYVCSGLEEDMVPRPPRRKKKGLALPKFERMLLGLDFVECDFKRFARPRIGHRALPKGDIDQLSVSYVAMFRDPRLRLYSAYTNGLHAVGIRSEARNEMYRQVRSPRDFVEYPGIRHCQTKMMLGFKCADDVNLTQADLERAVQRMRHKFAFVGITDDWNRSMCVFYRMFGGKINRHAFTNIRETATRDNGDDRRTYNAPLSASQAFAPEDDPLDWQLYLEARRIQEQNLVKYGLSCSTPGQGKGR